MRVMCMEFTRRAYMQDFGGEFTLLHLLWMCWNFIQTCSCKFRCAICPSFHFESIKPNIGSCDLLLIIWDTHTRKIHMVKRIFHAINRLTFDIKHVSYTIKKRINLHTKWKVTNKIFSLEALSLRKKK